MIREETMKKAMSTLAIIMIAGCLASMAWADQATRDEAVQKCAAAAQLVQEEGVDRAIQIINQRSGPFVWKDSYVFLMDMNGRVLAHPFVPELIERKDLLEVENSDGQFLFVEFIKVAHEKENGWVDYMWPMPGQIEPVAKTTYIQRIPGTMFLVAAGIHK
jgi:cytochrome c